MIRRVLAVLALGALLSCGAQSGTETGNPPLFADVQLALTARASDPAVARLPGEAGAGVEVASAWISVGRIRLVHAERCDTPEETEVDLGAAVAELVTDPQLLDTELEAAEFCRIRVRLERAEAPPSGAPAELAGRSIVLSGTRTDGVPFAIASRDEFDLDLRSRGAPFRLDEARRALVLAFDVSRWLGGVPLDQAAVEGGRIRIDDDANRDLLDAFEDRLDAALALHDDLDEDGEVDDDEEEPIAD